MGSEYISRSRFSTGPTPCTGWGRKTSSGRTRLSFGLDRHLRTENIHFFTGRAGWWCPPQFRRVPPWRRTFGKAARSCRTKSESQKIFSNVMQITTNMDQYIWLDLPSPSSSGCPLETSASRARGLRPQRRSGSAMGTGSVVSCYFSKWSESLPKPTGRGEFWWHRWHPPWWGMFVWNVAKKNCQQLPTEFWEPGKKRESGFEAVARSNVPDNIGDLGRVPGWLLLIWNHGNDQKGKQKCKMSE